MVLVGLQAFVMLTTLLVKLGPMLGLLPGLGLLWPMLRE
jgi:hypothetical protein